jgi:DNA topoisomerase-2
MPKHTRTFFPVTLADRGALDLAFNKTFAEGRKAWIGSLEPGTHLDYSADEISIEDFVNRDLVLFGKLTLGIGLGSLFITYHSLYPSIDLAMSDNVRSIPSMVDGLKPGERKILFACFLRKLVNDMLVSAKLGHSGRSCIPSVYHDPPY